VKASDLKEAQRLADLREQHARLLSRVDGGEALRFILGEGDKASEIVMSASYLAGVKNDVRGGLTARIAECNAALQRLGVEP
jgi:hypothetical protein